MRKNEKFKLIKEDTKIIFDKKVRRIKALKDFGDVKAGDLGGYISSVKNLSDEGDCWVYDEGVVLDSARVTENAKLINGVLYDFAIIRGDSIVTKSYISEDVVVVDSQIFDSELLGCVKVKGVELKNCRLDGYFDIVEKK